ncbi:MAG: hypothetical protein Q8P57_03150 [Candidatus Pacearchaeota archaeon]|nr:hypothetical protein [Candidatus Pacearchaeota archaeon]
MEPPGLIPQRKPTFCVCSILQGILNNHGIQISQEEIANNLTPSAKGHRVDDHKIKDFLRLKGFEYNFYWHNETPFNEPLDLVDEISINHGLMAYGTHAYRIIRFEYPFIVAEDPADSSRRRFEFRALMREIGERGGGFGLIRRLD